MGAALRSWWADPGEEACRAVVAAAERLGVADDDARLIAIVAVAARLLRGATVIDRLSRLAGTGGRDARAAALLAEAGHTMFEFDLARRFTDEATAQLRSQGRLAPLAQVLTMAAYDAFHSGDFRRAELMADEAGRLARETAQQIWIAGTQVAAALLAAVRGDEGRVEPLLGEAELVTVPRRLSSILCVGALARGVAALGAGRRDDAFAHLERMFDRSDPAFHHVDRFSGITYLADAAVHSGNEAAARSIIGDLERLLDETPSAGLRVLIGYARLVLADDEDAESMLETALHGEFARWPFHRARLELAYGAWLRRQRRPADSRPFLRAARETFDALGANPWAERSRQELRASGERSRRRVPDARDALSPQELQIAELAASGLSNRQIGQQLYLSHRTVASHLYRSFPKLGIGSRAQLTAVLGSARGLRG
jgi:ATP/maltotriose-dependent transcriptional regulator MalT